MALLQLGRRPRRRRSSEKARAINRKTENSSGILGAWRSFSANADWSRIRINLVIGVFCLFWGALWLRAWHLQMIAGPHLANRAMQQHTTSEKVAGKRGMIFDRNGQVLARSVEARSVYANPAQVENAAAAASALAPILDMPARTIEESLNKSRRFVWLKRKVDDNTALAVRKAGIAGIGLSREYDRFYPFKHMAGQLLGFVGVDGKGLEGLERSLDDELGSLPVLQTVHRDAKGRRFYLNGAGPAQAQGDNIALTLDMRIQFLAEEAVARAAKEFDARWSGALVVDVKSGDILAWAQYPFFDPNLYKDSTPKIYRNRLAADALEPGSTFKPLVMAAALQEKKVTPNTLIDCEGGKWSFKNFTIRDTSTRGILPASKVMRYSSNIGMAKIGQSMGARQFHSYLTRLGFGEPTALPVNDSRGILRKPRDWGEFDVMAAAFGQSVSVTPLQMAQAYLTFLNDGVYKPLRLVNAPCNVEDAPRRIFSSKNVALVMDMMRDVVEEPDGTGKRAKIPGVETAGKTGTAQKADASSKTYGEKRLASFVGFLPARDPQYLILVFVDEPTRNPYGGVVAAPAFKEIATQILAQNGAIGTPPQALNAAAQAKRKRGFKLASAPGQPWLGQTEPAIDASPRQGMQLPGHLARASDRIPDVLGKSVRNAVELFARAGIVPELKGAGGRVVRQTPPAGSPWPEKSSGCILWLSES